MILSLLAGKSESFTKNSCHFVRSLESLNLQHLYTLVSVGVASLFTDVPVDEALQVVSNKLHNDDTQVNGLPCTKFDALPLSDPSRNRIKPDTRLQIKGRKNHHVHPAAWNVVHWLPGYVSTIIYRCIALLQLLYKWQHQSRKLWTPLVNPHLKTVSAVLRRRSNWKICQNSLTFKWRKF
jgi:hypothetical protein